MQQKVSHTNRATELELAQPHFTLTEPIGGAYPRDIGHVLRRPCFHPMHCNVDSVQKMQL